MYTLSRSSTLTSLYCRHSLRCQAANNGGEDRKPFNIFQKVAIRKTRCAYILGKALWGNWAYFHLVHMKLEQEEFS